MLRNKKLFLKFGREGFTLLELIIVITLVGIMAAFAVPQFSGVRRKALDTQAKEVLKLIKAAEDTYRLKVGGFTNCVDTARCNARLNLNLSTTGNWGYNVINAGTSRFCIQATGSGTGDWHRDEVMLEAAGGLCP